MSEKGKEKEATRGMKHLLIHELLQYGLRVFEPVAMKKAVDIAICDEVGGELRCVSAQVRTCSLLPPREGAKQWYYEFSVAGRDDFHDSSTFFHKLKIGNQKQENPPNTGNLIYTSKSNPDTHVTFNG